MDVIIVKTHEDMDSITTWVDKFIRASAPSDLEEEIDFQIPFRRGKVQLLFEGCSLNFEADESGDTIFFKLYAHPAYIKADWAKELTSDKELLGGFTLTITPFKISDKWFNMSGNFAAHALEYEKEHNLFTVFAYQWFALMMLALYYKPEFESSRQSTEVSSSSKKKGKKSGKGKRVKMLYTRTYVITGDITDKLPKPVKKHTKPDHEFSVRGHFRQYKSGKRVWVNPHIRCKGRKPSEGSTYIAKIAGGESHDNS